LIKVHKGNILSEENGKADRPQSRDVPPSLQVVLEHCVSPILIRELFAVATSVDNKKSSQNLDCMYNDLRLVFARKI
jgi:hypothetical protein